MYFLLAQEKQYEDKIINVYKNNMRGITSKQACCVINSIIKMVWMLSFLYSYGVHCTSYLK